MTPIETLTPEEQSQSCQTDTLQKIVQPELLLVWSGYTEQPLSFVEFWKSVGKACWLPPGLWGQISAAWGHCPGSWHSWSFLQAADRQQDPRGEWRRPRLARRSSDLHSPNTHPTCCCRKQTGSLLILPQRKSDRHQKNYADASTFSLFWTKISMTTWIPLNHMKKGEWGNYTFTVWRRCLCASN